MTRWTVPLLVGLFGFSHMAEALIFSEEDIQRQMGQIESGQSTFLIINGDDFGMSHCTNMGMMECFERGIMTSATIMMPCYAIDEAIAYKKDNPQVDVGLHLTLNSEWGKVKWSTVAPAELVPSLVDPEGNMWEDTVPLLCHAKVPDARREAQAQITRAKEMGLDFNHLDCHMGWYHYNEHLFQMMRGVAVAERLPIREYLPHRKWQLGGARIRHTDDLDWSLNGTPKEKLKGTLIEFIVNLKPGITELVWHPALADEELRSITGTAESRDMQRQVLLDPDVRRRVEERGVVMIGYEPLRRLTQKK